MTTRQIATPQDLTDTDGTHRVWLNIEYTIDPVRVLLALNGTVDNEDEGKHVADASGDGKAVILQKHGLVTVQLCPDVLAGCPSGSRRPALTWRGRLSPRQAVASLL